MLFNPTSLHFSSSRDCVCQHCALGSRPHFYHSIVPQSRLSTMESHFPPGENWSWDQFIEICMDDYQVQPEANIMVFDNNMGNNHTDNPAISSHPAGNVHNPFALFKS